MKDSRLLPTAVSLVQMRHVAGSRPGHRQDPYRLALIIEGGGMRGVVAGGMVSALEHLGVVDCFDAVYGTSAGACAGAYLLAGQALHGTRIFYQDINNPRFLRLGRALVGRPVMNIDYLIDQVMDHVRRLDADRVIASPIALTMIATDVSTGRPVPLTDFRSRADLMNGLRASTRLPLVGGRPVSGAGGLTLVDGAMSAPIPGDLAVAAGATHLIVLSTRPDITTIDGGPSRPWFARLLARRISPAVAAVYLNRPRLYHSLSASLTRDHWPASRPVPLTVIRPQGLKREVRKIERRRAKLLRGAQSGWAAVMQVLDPDGTDRHFPDLDQA